MLRLLIYAVWQTHDYILHNMFILYIIAYIYTFHVHIIILQNYSHYHFIFILFVNSKKIH